jgi:UDP-glucose:(heptosyl)LPS alpha-1,3-glucosyltransferase
MPSGNLSIGFVRRGYSASGGAESYLKRLGLGVVELGHDVCLFTTKDWPASEWPFGRITEINAGSPIGFADEVEKRRARVRCDVLVSFERIWRCDVFRAGDGVHQAWLNRREKFEAPWRTFGRRFNRKHRDLLRLEKSLLDDRGAERVIANSQMVKIEIIDIYNYRRDKIDIVHNGVPLGRLSFDPLERLKSRADLGLEMNDVAALFVGSNWERKGLRYAIEAVEALANRRLRLFVAGHGNPERYRSSRVSFLGETVDLRLIYAAADIFILPTIYDPFSNASLEALACGLPVITTRANGFSEVMEDRIHGSLIDLPNNVHDLRSALETWSDPTQRMAARPSILKCAAQFDISKSVEQTVAILVQAAAAGAGSTAVKPQQSQPSVGSGEF